MTGTAKTLFLGAYGFGNLGDELCLLEALDHFPTSDGWVRSVDPAFTQRHVSCRGFVPWPPGRQPADARVDCERIVVGGGGIFYDESIIDFMSWIIAGQNAGAQTYVHNVAVSHLPTLEWLTPAMAAAFSRLDGFSVRDAKSVELVEAWGIGVTPDVTPFPEREVEADMAVASLLPPGPILGISITMQEAMHEALEYNRAFVARWLDERTHMKVLPVVSVVHRDGVEDDARGFERFAEMFLKDFEVVLPAMLDHDWWHRTVTPRNLKGLISRCSVLLSQRKHNCVHAIGAGVPVAGIFPSADDNLPRVFASLSRWLPDGSALLPL